MGKGNRADALKGSLKKKLFSPMPQSTCIRPFYNQTPDARRISLLAGPGHHWTERVEESLSEREEREDPKKNSADPIGNAGKHLKPWKEGKVLPENNVLHFTETQ